MNKVYLELNRYIWIYICTHLPQFSLKARLTLVLSLESDHNLVLCLERRPNSGIKARLAPYTIFESKAIHTLELCLEGRPNLDIVS